MKPTDIAAMVSTGDPQLSPDGSTVAYVLQRVDEEANSYTSQVWIAAVDSSTRPRALTAGEHRDGQPRWSPDGTQLAFTSTRKADAKGKTRSTLHLLPVHVPGETVLLADGDEGFGDLAFSPDGSTIAVTKRTRSAQYTHDEVGRQPARKIETLFTTLNGEGFIYDRPQHIYLVPTDGSGKLRNITPGPWEFSQPAWFPDGQRIVASVNRFPDNFSGDLAIIDLTAATETDRPDDLATGTPPAAARLLTDGTGHYSVPTVSPDGSQILTGGIDDMSIVPQNEHLGLLDPAATEPATPKWTSHAIDRNWVPFTAGSRPTWVSDTEVLAGIEDRGNSHLLRLDVVSGETTMLVSGDLTVTGWSHQPSVSDPHGTIVFAATTATTPAEIFVLRDGKHVALTSHGKAAIARISPQEPEHFLAPSGDVEVDAWIITPPNFDADKTWPMLLNIHGGPFTQYGNYLFDEVQMQAAAGYVVIYANPRGGSGRTDDWGHAVLGPKHPKKPGTGWGGDDYNDLMAVVDTALERYPFIDPDRVGVLGGSYGGYMTSWMLTHTDRFAAGCSERAVNNLITLEHSSDIAGFFPAELGPRFFDDPEEYARMSPMTYVKDLNTPLLIVHSEDDLRCPAEQAWQLFNACKLLGKPDVEFWLFPGENHELSRSGSPSHRKQRAEIILEFFGRHLGVATSDAD